MSDTVDLLDQFAARYAAREDQWKITHPTEEELQAALAELETTTTACGRCGWVCGNPHPGMPQFQMVCHALRHREVAAMSIEDLTHGYRMTQIIIHPWDNQIMYAELKRRDVDTLAISPYMYQTYA